MKKIKYAVLILSILLTGCSVKPTNKEEMEQQETKQVKTQPLIMEQLSESLAPGELYYTDFRLQNPTDKAYEEVETSLEKLVKDKWVEISKGRLNQIEAYENRKNYDGGVNTRSLLFFEGSIQPQADIIVEYELGEIKLNLQETYRLKSKFREDQIEGEKENTQETFAVTVNIKKRVEKKATKQTKLSIEHVIGNKFEIINQSSDSYVITSNLIRCLKDNKGIEELSANIERKEPKDELEAGEDGLERDEKGRIVIAPHTSAVYEYGNFYEESERESAESYKLETVLQNTTNPTEKINVVTKFHMP